MSFKNSVYNYMIRLESILRGRIFSYYFPLAVVAATIGFYYWLILVYSINIPAADDYGTALNFLNTYIHLDSFQDKITLLFSQHGEHRIMVPSLVILIYYLITGHANFYAYVVIGNLGLAGIGWMYYKSAPVMENKMLFLAPVASLTFQLIHWESATFSTPSIQIFYVVLFCQIALYSVGISTTTGLVVALAAIFLATFTSGSGILGFVPCILVLLIQKRYKALGLWLLFFGFTAWIYFHQFGNSNTPFVLEAIMANPLDPVKSFFGLIGSFLNFAMPWDENVAEFNLSLVIGIVIVIFFLYLTISRYYLRSPVLYNFLLLMLMTGAIVAVSRTNLYTPVVMSAVSRYKIIPISIIVCCYTILVDLFHKRIRLTVAMIVIALGIWYNYYSFERDINIFKINIESVMETSWAIYNKNDYSKIKDFNPAACEVVLKESMRQGIYTVPDLRDDFMRRTSFSEEPVPLSWDQILPADSMAQFDFDIYHTSNKDLICIRNGWAFEPGTSPKSHLLALKSVDRSYFFSAFFIYRSDLTEKFHATHPTDSIRYDLSGFFLSVPTKNLSPGEYEMGVVIENFDGSNHYIPANKKIIL